MRSLSFPAIGTGLLSFPKDLVARVLLEEVRTFSRKKTPQHLLKVFVVVHPSDSGTERVSAGRRSLRLVQLGQRQKPLLVLGFLAVLLNW